MAEREWSFRINGKPATKKNSSNIIVHPKTGRPMLIPSKTYKDYEREAVAQLQAGGIAGLHIEHPVNIMCTYYMPTRRRVDLTNLLSATMDILVKADVITDDNRDVAASNDGSRVYYDKNDPHVTIMITDADDDYEVWK